jgi:hypothetical protein
MELRPAHEVVVRRIKEHCETLESFDRMLKRKDFPAGYQRGMTDVTVQQQLGGLDSQLSTLIEMIIPEDKLPGVIAALKQLTYRHLILDSAIEELTKRLPPKSGSVGETIQ